MPQIDNSCNKTRKRTGDGKKRTDRREKWREGGGGVDRHSQTSPELLADQINNTEGGGNSLRRRGSWWEAIIQEVIIIII